MSSSEISDEPTPVEPEPAPVPDYEAPPPVDENPRWTVLSIIAYDGHEPPPSLSNSEALGIWTTISAP